ncbi:Internal alternative NAD(P)H-ubiquinone oxidoreductase [Forsythia ovata]|uniref:Internal alternative NAD(P)H-ubiquinone oxidoreductase n=1 Tax=Forsythia ovata TaxID=205694 RepID=A0ABD1WXK2_9LAMI
MILSFSCQDFGYVQSTSTEVLKPYVFNELVDAGRLPSLGPAALFMAAKEIGALQVAKGKLEKEVEELTRQLQLEKCMRSGVHLVRGIVKDVQPQKIILSDGTDIPFGLLVWSTGVGPSPFVNSLDIPKHLVEGINKSASKQYIHFFATLFHQIVQIRTLDFSKSFKRNLLQSLGARPPWEL